jgi:hypothetical protein
MHRTALFLLPSLCSIVPAALAQWSAPALVPSVNSTSADSSPKLTFDGLTLYFSSGRASSGGYQLWRATRTAPFGTFGSPTAVSELNAGTNVIDEQACPRIDHLEIFFVSNRPGGVGSYDIWRATRASTSVPFNTPVPVTEINATGDDGSPSLTGDGLRIYFGSSRPGGVGSYDIWTATRPNWSSPFSTPTPVTELGTTAIDFQPHVSPDDLTMLFNSRRPGGLGNNDFWMATRLNTSSPFANFVNLTALNTAVADDHITFAIFHDEVFFASDRPGTMGSYDVFTARLTGLLGASALGGKDLRFSDPSSAARVYVAASSLGTSPGIPIDTRVLPLNGDLLLRLRVGGLPPILTGFVGSLDPNGIASGKINFAGFPEFRGLRFFSAFCVFDQAAPSGIKTISNAYEMQVQ